jgi:hypothetical protein
MKYSDYEEKLATLRDKVLRVYNAGLAAKQTHLELSQEEEEILRIWFIEDAITPIADVDPQMVKVNDQEGWPVYKPRAAVDDDKPFGIPEGEALALLEPEDSALEAQVRKYEALTKHIEELESYKKARRN